MLNLAASFALGIFLAHPEPKALVEITQIVAALLAGGGFVFLVGLVFMRLGWRRPALWSALAGFAIAGAASSYLFEARFPLDHVRYLASSGADLNSEIRMKAVVVSDPLRTPYGLQFDVEAKSYESGALQSQARSHALTGKVRLRLEASENSSAWSSIDAMNLQYGDSIQAMVRLEKPRSYQNPGSFDFRNWMESIQDLYWLGAIKSPLQIEKLPGHSSPGLSALVHRIRLRLIKTIDRLYPPWSNEVRDGAVLKAVLLGDRGSLDSDTIQNFQATGLYHLLVVAGLHIGLLALILNSLFRALPLSAAWRSCLVMASLGIFALLVEQRAPTLRASLMVFFYLIARQLYREHAALNSIGFAALVLLIQRPAWLFETGFQLSFSAALVIAALAVPILMRTTEPYRRALWNIHEVDLDMHLAPRQAQFRLEIRLLIAWLKKQIPFLSRTPRFLSFSVLTLLKLIVWTANALIFSAILQIGLLLPMSEYFHRVAIAGIGLNALAIPVMTLLLGFALPTVILGTISPSLAAWPAKLLALLLKLLFFMTDLPGLSHWLSFRVAEPPAWVAWGFVMAWVIAAISLGRARLIFRASALGMVAMGFLIALHPFAPNLSPGALEVTALDCGGGDAIFVAFPDRTTMLLDACGSRAQNTRPGTFQGRRWDPGEEIVSPYLWTRGIEKIDIVALSDARQESMSGLPAVIRNFHVGEFWHGANPITPAYSDLLGLVRRRGIPAQELAAGDQKPRGSTLVLALWPPGGGDAGVSSSVAIDDNSLVLRVSDGAGSVLLPGDISAKTERLLVRSGVPLQSRVLEVAHHGSRTSSIIEFLERAAPQVALISAEGGTRAGGPSAETLNRLHRVGAQVFRTDVSGAVTVEMRGATITVHPYRGSGTG